LSAAKRSGSSGGDEGAPQESPPGTPSIELREEQLGVDARRVEAGSARLHKRVVTEEQKLEIPVLVDARLVIKRRAVARRPGTQPAASEILVPLIREQISLERHPRVYQRARFAVETKTSEHGVDTELRREELREERQRIGGQEENGSGGDPRIL
jgi:uncharacterized protein (TIGR02271 family)